MVAGVFLHIVVKDLVRESARILEITMKQNVYLIIIFANVFLTLGNALLGRKLGHIPTFNILLLLWGGKLIVGGMAYGCFRQGSMFDLRWEVALAIVGVGMVCGLGEGLLFAGLAKNTNLVAALGCLYPLLLLFWAFLLTREPPNREIVIAVALAAASMFFAYRGTLSP